jgi:hypothetical protein
MAKHCTLCDQDYADELEACPRCSTARTTKMASRSEERTTQLADLKRQRPDEPPTLDDGPLASDVSAEAILGAIAADRDSASSINLGATPDESGEDLWGQRAVGDVDASADKGTKSAVNLGATPDESGEDLWGERAVEAMDASAVKAAPSPAPKHSEEVVEAVGDSGIDFSNVDQPVEASDAALEAMLSDAPGVEADAGEAELAESADSGVTVPEEAADMGEGEEAMAAVDDEEEVAALEAKDDEKPAKPVKPRSPILALAGSACAGVLIGVLGTIGTQALMGSGDKGKSPALSIVSPQAKQAPSFESLVARVASGDWDEAETGGIEQAPGTTPKELVARGQYRLGKYLKSAGSKINPDDATLKSAIEDLKTAAGQGDANAVYDLALIQELAGKLPEAKAEYEKGAQTFAKDPMQKERFDSAILRVEWKAVLKGSGAAMLRLPQRMQEDAVLLALLLIALEQQAEQQPGQQAQPAGQPAQAPAKAENKEAGFDFWQAAKLAHEGKFSDAVRAIDKARKLHEERRFSRLRKAQNPLSDPAEDIFLRCCDELKAYWHLEARLRDGGYLTDDNTPTDALQMLVQKADSSHAMAKSFMEKLIAAKVIGKDEDASKGLDRVLAEKQGSDAKLADLKTMLQNAKNENAQLDGKVKAAEKTATERDTALASAKKEMENLKTSNDDLSATLKELRDQLAKAKDAQGTVRQQPSESARSAAPVKGSPPAAIRPVVVRAPNPMEAEKHFSAGLNFYFDRDYANAEKEFLLTVENDSQDARFFYFLGLSKLAQNRRGDAAPDLEQGAMLERLNRPAPAAVNESLERIQGPMRAIVNNVRERPVK